MRPKTYAALVDAIRKAIDDESDDRSSGLIYYDLDEDMANAARAVYDACIKSSEFTEQEMS